MSCTVTIDFQDRTRASITYEGSLPRSGDAWTEMLYHLAFCVGRTLVNLDREDQVECARQFDAWAGNAFTDFPIHVGPPAMLIPCARFVSSFDGDVPSYVRGAYGFGLNARGLDYYGPMATGVLLRHVHGVWERPNDLLRPVRALCRRVAADGVDEAGHVMLITECVTRALDDMRRRGTVSPSKLRLVVPEVRPADRRFFRNALVGVWLALVLVAGVSWYLAAPPPAMESRIAKQFPGAAPTVPVRPPTTSPPSGEPGSPPVERKPVYEADKGVPQRQVLLAEEIRKREEAEQARVTEEQRMLEELRQHRKAEQEQARLAELKRQEEEARRAEAARRKVEEERIAAMKRETEELRVAEAKRQQEARVSKPVTPPVLEKSMVGKDGAPMVLVLVGEFLMGSEAEGDAPPHRVYLDAFYIDRHEVTNARYLKFVETTRHRAPQHVVDPQYDLWVGTALSHGVANLPVVNVDWADADAYCKWAGKRLPTEAEWEKAARGTDGRLYPWGNDLPSSVRLNFSSRWQGPYTLKPVGSFESGTSPYGALDMAGNVWEWVGDWYDAGSYSAGPERNPRGPSSGSSKILRGGSWTNQAESVRVTHRREEDPEMRDSDSGFRCARSAN